MGHDCGMAESQPTRWDLEQIAHQDRWQSYVDRFTRLHESGADADGEARFVDALAERDSVVLDAGCGAGRVAAVLRERGHNAVGVDKDAGHISVGRSRYRGLPLLAHDLLTVDAAVLHRAQMPAEFDIVLLAGNVMVYLAPGSEGAVVDNLAGLLRTGGKIVIGFATDREYGVDRLDEDAARAGLTLQHRFSTWQLAPYHHESGWAVSVFVR